MHLIALVLTLFSCQQADAPSPGGSGSSADPVATPASSPTPQRSAAVDGALPAPDALAGWWFYTEQAAALIEQDSGSYCPGAGNTESYEFDVLEFPAPGQVAQNRGYAPPYECTFDARGGSSNYTLQARCWMDMGGGAPSEPSSVTATWTSAGDGWVRTDFRSQLYGKTTSERFLGLKQSPESLRDALYARNLAAFGRTRSGRYRSESGQTFGVASNGTVRMAGQELDVLVTDCYSSGRGSKTTCLVGDALGADGSGALAWREGAWISGSFTAGSGCTFNAAASPDRYTPAEGRAGGGAKKGNGKVRKIREGAGPTGKVTR